MQKLTNLLFELLAIILEKHRGLYLPLAFKEYFHKRSNIHNYETRHVNDLNLTNNRKSFSDHSIQTCGPILWNTLPTAIKDSKSVNHFRNQLNPNSIRSYKIVQNYLQNTQHVVLRNRPTLSIGTERLACLNNPPWRAAGDPRPARGRSWVRAPGPAGARCARFFFPNPPFLPPSGDSSFSHLPHPTNG